MTPAPRPTFFELCCEEPFRIFFPLGALFGISGVSLWPLYFSGLHKFYPGIMHARLVTEGFLGAFIIGFLAMEIPVHRFPTPAPTIPQNLRLALILLLLGLLFPVLWPGQRVAGLHVIFIGGFSLVTFTVATRVVLGHSGQGHFFGQPLPFLRGAAGLLILAAVFRVMGDFFPIRRGPILELAAYLWMLAAGIWSWRVLPRVRIADPET